MSEEAAEENKIHLQFSKEERDFIVRTIKDCPMPGMIEKIKLAEPLPKLRSYVECYVTPDELIALERALRYEAKSGRKKVIADAAQDLMEILQGLRDSLK